MITKTQIKEAITEKKIKQPQFAEWMGVTVHAVRIWMQENAPAALSPRIANDERIKALVYGDGRFIYKNLTERVRDALEYGCNTYDEVEKHVNNPCRIKIENRKPISFRRIKQAVKSFEMEDFDYD